MTLLTIIMRYVRHSTRYSTIAMSSERRLRPMCELTCDRCLYATKINIFDKKIERFWSDYSSHQMITRCKTDCFYAFNDKSLPFINRIMETRKSFLFYGSTQHIHRIFCEFDIFYKKNSSEIKFLGKGINNRAHPTTGRFIARCKWVFAWLL